MLSEFDFYVKETKSILETYPQQKGKFRCFADLYGPFNFLSDVPFDYSAHYPRDKYYYICDDWSTIFSVNNYKKDGLEHYCCCLESSNESPILGERVILFSTSSSIWNEPWGQNKANVYAYFRDNIYGVDPIIFLGRWKGNLRYPLVDRLRNRTINKTEHDMNYQPGDFLTPTIFLEKDDKKYYGFYKSIEENPYDPFNWNILCDFLIDNQEPQFSSYIRNCINIIFNNNNPEIINRIIENVPLKVSQDNFFCDRLFKLYIIERLNVLRIKQISSIINLDRKLKATWTVEAEQDLMQFHDINIEDDWTFTPQQILTDMLVKEFNDEWNS